MHSNVMLRQWFESRTRSQFKCKRHAVDGAEFWYGPIPGYHRGLQYDVAALIIAAELSVLPVLFIFLGQELLEKTFPLK